MQKSIPINDSALDHPNKLRGYIHKDSIRRLFYVSTFKGILSIFVEWFLIISSAYICEVFFSWPLYIFMVIFIGARLLALGLIMHEAVHLLISKNKILNDFLGEFFCAWPLFISMRSYRVKHLAHHKWLNTEKDPDYIAKTDINWSFPMPLKKFYSLILIQLSGLGIFETFKVMSGKHKNLSKPPSPLYYRVSRILFYIVIISACVYWRFGNMVLMYWIIPFATWTQFVNRLRRIAEHSGIKERSLPMQTRTTKHSFLMRVFFVPKNISYHCEHHLYPGIPCYNLPKAHEEFLKYEIVQDNFYMSNGYRDVFNDCISNKTNS